MLRDNVIPQQQEEDYIVSLSSDSNGKAVRYYISSLDYYPEGGSLLIDFGGVDEEVLGSNALVLIGIRENRLSSIEILLDDKSVINRLDRIFSENMDRE